jgi:hypothetical protein
MKAIKSAAVEKAGWTVDQWKYATGLGHTTVYDLLKTGRIKSSKIGKRRIITTSPKEFLASEATA